MLWNAVSLHFNTQKTGVCGAQESSGTNTTCFRPRFTQLDWEIFEEKQKNIIINLNFNLSFLLIFY